MTFVRAVTVLRKRATEPLAALGRVGEMGPKLWSIPKRGIPQHMLRQSVTTVLAAPETQSFTREARAPTAHFIPGINTLALARKEWNGILVNERLVKTLSSE